MWKISTLNVFALLCVLSLILEKEKRINNTIAFAFLHECSSLMCHSLKSKFDLHAASRFSRAYWNVSCLTWYCFRFLLLPFNLQSFSFCLAIVVAFLPDRVIRPKERRKTFDECKHTNRIVLKWWQCYLRELL